MNEEMQTCHEHLQHASMGKTFQESFPDAAVEMVENGVALFGDQFVGCGPGP